MVQSTMAQERLSALRETISRLENENMPGAVRSFKTPDPSGFRQASDPVGRRKILPLGVPALDAVLEGGLPLAGLTEIRAQETRNAGAATGFTLALAALCQSSARTEEMCAPILWIGQPMAMTEAGHPYAIGLGSHGLDAGQCLFACPRTLQDALWIAEAALDVAAFAAVILEIRGNPASLALSESRRLHVRARSGGVPFLLLRQAGEEEASSALFRLHVGPAPASARPLPDGSTLAGSIGHPVFHVTIEKSRVFSPAGLFIEWNPHDRRFCQLDRHAIAVPAQPAHSVAQLSPSSGGSGGAHALGRLLDFKRSS